MKTDNGVLALMDTKMNSEGRPLQEIRVGDPVIVRRNPHNTRAEPVVGTVIAVQIGEGVDGTDLFEVQYCDPDLQVTTASPFNASHLETATPDALVTLAARHHKLASALIFQAAALAKNRSQATT